MTPAEVVQLQWASVLCFFAVCVVSVLVALLFWRASTRRNARRA